MSLLTRLRSLPWHRVAGGRARIDVTRQFTSHLVAPALPRPADLDRVPANSVNWFIPGFRQGAGGHLNIFRFVRALESRGFDCRIVFGRDDGRTTAAAMKEQIQRQFGDIQASVHLGVESAPPAMACMATGWSTAYAARRFQAARHHFYFVQDFEPWFYPAGSKAAFAEATYGFGFTGITAGTWLAHKLHAEHGMTTHALGFSYDKHLYGPQGRPPQGQRPKRVFFYARAATARRGFELGLLALRRLHERLPDVQIVLAGMDASRYEVPFPHEDLGVLRIEQLPAVYRSCDAALVLSMTNASLLPLEIMACGTPVVSNRGAWVEWLLSANEALLCNPTIDALADGMYQVLTEPQTWQRLHANGLAKAAGTSWQAEADRLIEILGRHDCVPPPLADVNVTAGAER